MIKKYFTVLNNKIYLFSLIIAFLTTPNISAADNPVISSDTQLNFSSLKETEIVYDNNNDTLYINQKLFSEDKFLRIEMNAVKEKKLIFYLYTQDDYYIWWISGGKAEAYKKAPDTTKISQYKNSILKNAIDKINEHNPNEVKNYDELKIDILPVSTEYTDSSEVYCLSSIITDIAGQVKREQKIWISPDRRILKEHIIFFKPQYKNILNNNWIIDSIVNKFYEYNTVFSDEISEPPQGIEFISK